MKNIYIIKEAQNVNSERKGERIEADSLSAAKRAASRAQMFQGSVMKIENEYGLLLAYKEDGRWVEVA